MIPGNEIVTLSNPQGFNYSLSTGIVSALRDWNKNHQIGYGEYIQITATIAHGSSGGPLFNKKGEYIDVIEDEIDNINDEVEDLMQNDKERIEDDRIKKENELRAKNEKEKQHIQQNNLYTTIL